MLARLLAAMLARLVLTRPMLARRLLTRRMLTRRMLTRLVLLGAGFGVRLGRGPRRALAMLARLPGLAARAARLVAGAAATAARPRPRRRPSEASKSAMSRPGTSMRGNGGADQLLDRLRRDSPSEGEARVKEWPVLPARPVRPMRWT